MATTKRRRSKTFKLMENKDFVTEQDVDADSLTYIKTDIEDDAKTPSFSNGDSDSYDSSKMKDGEEGYVVLDLHNKNDLKELDNTFNTMVEALSSQKAKLAAKWDFLNHNNNNNNKNKNNKKKTSKDKKIERIEKSLLIDLKHMLERIEKIGMIRGKKFEELEEEQNKAIEKLSSVVDLEEEARVSRNKAIELQKETELEMKEIDAQSKIIETELKKAEPELLAARLAVEDINDRALNELISLKKPPSTVTNVLTVAVWIVNSVDDNTTTTTRGNKTTVALKGAHTPNSRSFGRSHSTRTRRTRTVESTETAQLKLGNISDNRFSKSRRKQAKTPKASKMSKSSKNRFKSGKRGRAQSTGLELKDSDLEKMRPKTPMSREFSKHASALSLTPLSESQSQVKERSKSKGLLRSKDKNKRNSTTPTPGHKKSGSRTGSRIDKLKARNFEKILTQPWSDTRVMLTRGNFKKRVLAFDPKKLPKKIAARIEKEFLPKEDFTVLRANQASKVLGPLVKWIRSLIGYTTIWYKIEPMANKVAEYKRALGIKQLEVKKLKNISEESHLKVIKIRSEMLKMVGYHKIGGLYFLS